MRSSRIPIIVFLLSVMPMTATLINQAASALRLPHRMSPRLTTPLLTEAEPPPPPPPVDTIAEDDGDDDGDDDGNGGLLPLAIAVLALAKRFPLAPAALVVGSVRPLRRALRSWSTIFPMVVQLKLFELRKFDSLEAKLAARDALDERLSTEFADFIGSMRGAFVKVAQVLGSLSPSPVRRPYIEKLEPMTDAAPGGRPWKEVQRQINRELRRGKGNEQRSISTVFSEFDPEPIGTASVGQVHRAVLRSDGRTVAVKLQYPDSKRLILTDLVNIHRILKLLGRAEEAGVVNEYRTRMGMEFDYESEGITMNCVADFFEQQLSPITRTDSSGERSLRVHMPPAPLVGRKIKVPRSMPELSTRRLLVMDYMEGGSLRDNLRGRYSSAMKQPVLFRLPRLLKLRRDTKRVLATLLEAQGEQIFTLGTFNADPHPGNVFLTSDGATGDSRIGLLDFGCSKTLTDAQRSPLRGYTSRLRSATTRASTERL